jgi:hypothetical protein
MSTTLLIKLSDLLTNLLPEDLKAIEQARTKSNFFRFCTRVPNGMYTGKIQLNSFLICLPKEVQESVLNVPKLKGVEPKTAAVLLDE